MPSNRSQRPGLAQGARPRPTCAWLALKSSNCSTALGHRFISAVTTCGDGRSRAGREAGLQAPRTPPAAKEGSPVPRAAAVLPSARKSKGTDRPTQADGKQPRPTSGGNQGRQAEETKADKRRKPKARANQRMAKAPAPPLTSSITS